MDLNDFSNFLKNISLKPLHVLDANIPKSKYVSLDLSKNNLELTKVNLSSSLEFSRYINSYLKKHNAMVAFGGYSEIRTLYNRSRYFTNGAFEKRNIHIGLDLWCDTQTPVYTPLDATIHSFKNNTNFGDYGPTIILKHVIENVEFYTLYGHLSLESIQGLKIGKPYKQGDAIATLGNVSVNGDYPPHLHFQIIKDMQGYVGDYPGVCNEKDLGFYSKNCPNPDVLLKLRH